MTLRKKIHWEAASKWGKL